MSSTLSSLPGLHRQRQVQTDSARINSGINTWTRKQHNIGSMELHRALVGHDGCVNALCWSRDGYYLFSGSDDPTICIWRACSDGALVRRFRSGFQERIFDLKLLPPPNDHLLVACSMDNSVKIYSTDRMLRSGFDEDDDGIADGDRFCVRTFSAHTAPAKRIAVIPDSPSEFLSCSEDGTVRHFDIREHNSNPRIGARGGYVVANYSPLHAQLFALDVNPFFPYIFAVGGTMTSIIIHDRRMGHYLKTLSSPYEADWEGDRCLVRLRRDRTASRENIYEKSSDNAVCGVRFSRDVPNLVVGSWWYDYVYLFDLNHSPTYTSNIQTDIEGGSSKNHHIDECLSTSKRRRLDRQHSQCHEMEDPVDFRAFVRGQSRGVRLLNADEAPYLLNSSQSSISICSDSSEELSDSRCPICGIRFNEVAPPNDSDSNLPSASADNELQLSYVVFDAFVADMAESSQLQATTSLTFLMRQMEDGGQFQDTNGHSGLLSLKRAVNVNDLEPSMQSLQSNKIFEHGRIRSLLHNNKACLGGTAFRLAWIEKLNTLSSLNSSDMVGNDLLSMFQEPRSNLESAIHNNRLALELNQYNILAHYNRILIAWDNMRLSIMLFVIEIQPLLASDKPETNRLRAEFGDMTYRIRQLHSQLRSDWGSIENATDSISTYCGICGSMIPDGENNGSTLTSDMKNLVHGNERFFEVSGELAISISKDSRMVLDGVLQNRTLFDGDMPKDIDPNDYESVLCGLSVRWKSLTVLKRHNMAESAEQPRNLVQNPMSIFKGELYIQCRPVATNESNDLQLPHVYLWHRHLPSISQRRTEEYDTGALDMTFGISRMPTFPTDNSYCQKASQVAESSRQSQSNESPEHTSSDSCDTDPMHMSENTSTESSEQEEYHENWPRATREYVPQVLNTSSGEEDSHSRTPIPVVLPCRRYMGHCNFQTTKDVNFAFGKYVASGSDDGNLFLWDRESMDVVQVVSSDNEVVNVVESHPSLPFIAVSGIDSEIKLFSLAQGGPALDHRQRFPLVRAHHLSETGVSDPLAARVFTNSMYAIDPYQKALERSKNWPLASSIGIGSFSRRLAQGLPYTSCSRLTELGQIITDNEDMRLRGQASASLTRQIMSNFMFSRMWEDEDSSDDTSEEEDSEESSASEEEYM